MNQLIEKVESLKCVSETHNLYIHFKKLFRANKLFFVLTILFMIVIIQISLLVYFFQAPAPGFCHLRHKVLPTLER